MKRRGKEREREKKKTEKLLSISSVFVLCFACEYEDLKIIINNKEKNSSNRIFCSWAIEAARSKRLQPVQLPRFIPNPTYNQ
jgi:hypothetical protein